MEGIEINSGKEVRGEYDRRREMEIKDRAKIGEKRWVSLLMSYNLQYYNTINNVHVDHYLRLYKVI